MNLRTNLPLLLNSMAGPIPGFTDPSQPAFGLFGVDYVNNTFAHTGHWFCFVPIEDTVVAEFNALTPVGGNAFVGDVLPAGIPVYFQFDSITLASGRIWAYRAKKDAV